MPARNPVSRAVLLVLRGLIRLYRYILSPWIGNQCRFHPTCSVYAEQALQQHGVMRGLILTFARLTRCHPWGEPGGADPVPDRFEWRAPMGYKRRKPDSADSAPRE